MPKPSTLHKRGRRKRSRRKAPPTTGYFVGRRHYATLQDVWNRCGAGDGRRGSRAEALYGDNIARAAADANGVFYVNGHRVQIVAMIAANVGKGLARLDRIAATTGMAGCSKASACHGRTSGHGNRIT